MFDIQDLANRIVGGLTGWEKLQGAHKIAHNIDENAARFVLCTLLAMQGHPYAVRTNVTPRTWQDQRLHVDLGLAGPEHQTQYGALEFKWLKNIDGGTARQDVLQDVARLCSIDAMPGAPRFLLVRASNSAMKLIFTQKHERSEALEAQRELICKLLPCDPTKPKAELATSEVLTTCPLFEDRCSLNMRTAGAGNIAINLLARSTVENPYSNFSDGRGQKLASWATILLWQCEHRN